MKTKEWVGERRGRQRWRAGAADTHEGVDSRRPWCPCGCQRRQVDQQQREMPANDASGW